jgi:hypothetical protein
MAPTPIANVGWLDSLILGEAPARKQLACLQEYISNPDEYRLTINGCINTVASVASIHQAVR